MAPGRAAGKRKFKMRGERERNKYKNAFLRFLTLINRMRGIWCSIPRGGLELAGG